MQIALPRIRIQSGLRLGCLVPEQDVVAKEKAE